MSRIRCCAPFCNRTIRAEKIDNPGAPVWVCAKHWKLAPKNHRRLYRRLVRQVGWQHARAVRVFSRIVCDVVDDVINQGPR